jgi:hypothetical protein
LQLGIDGAVADAGRPCGCDEHLPWAGRDGIELKDAFYLSPPDAWVHRLWTGAKDLSLRAYWGWRQQQFYFAAQVTDDLFAHDPRVLRRFILLSAPAAPGDAEGRPPDAPAAPGDAEGMLPDAPADPDLAEHR